MSITPSSTDEIEAPTETVTADATALNSSPAKPLTTTPLATAINNTLEASVTPESKLPKICFLFGAGAEAYYGMPLGARFAVKVFQQQQEGKQIFINIKDRVMDTLDFSKNENDLTPEQLQYRDALPNNGNYRIYALSPRSAGALIREFIQEHYEEILTFFNGFGSKGEWVLKQLRDDQYDLHLLITNLSQILGIPAPEKGSDYSENPVKWAENKLQNFVEQIEAKDFFPLLPSKAQAKIKKNYQGNNSQPKYLGSHLLDDVLLEDKGKKGKYSDIDNIWQMPLFKVLFTCSHILFLQLKKNSNNDNEQHNNNNITPKITFCNEVTLQSLQGILEIIAAATAQEYANKGNDLFARKKQISPLFDTMNQLLELNFDKVCSSSVKLLFDEQSGEAAPWKSAYEKEKNLLKRKSLPESTSTAGEGSEPTDTESEASKFPSPQEMESALPILTLMAQELFFTVASKFITYKGLIDGMWRYLYDPKSNWAKFTQLSCFLFAVHHYILNQAQHCSGEHGYYEQVQQAVSEGLFSLGTCATTNYTTLIRKRLFSQEEQKQLQDESYYLEHPNERKLAYLNGSTSFIYDPYLNDMREAPQDDENWTKTEQLKELKPLEHFVVPLMFTQSGTKAMTVVEMNDMYASLFHSWQESDAVVLVGFNCSKDDSHINSMLRKFLKLSNGQKPIIIVTRAPNAADFDPKDIQRGKTPEELCLADFANKLHLEDQYRDCLRLIGITDLVSNKASEDKQKRNNSVNGVMWYEELHRILQEWYQKPHDINAQSNPASVASGTSDEA